MLVMDSVRICAPVYSFLAPAVAEYLISMSLNFTDSYRASIYPV